MAIGSNADHFVILGRSKERSDAAQTPGSMPRRQSAATVQNPFRCIPRLMSRMDPRVFATPLRGCSARG
ncbi:hypothetical protein FJ977_06900 [Mesorhizobium sp. B2-1-3A]|nr:hypothetical protein FJ977_06900 [Mesorhizobium sp. B2-1-3A]